MQSDSSLFNDTREDADYEAVWEVATAVTSAGWNAEFRIPFSQIRFSTTEGERSVWGFQVRRDVRATGESDLWNAAPRGTQGFVSRFGHLTFRRPPVAAAPRRAAALQPRQERARVRWRQRRRLRWRPRYARRPGDVDHALGHHQSRLRPGRARPGCAEPVGLRNVLPGKAPVLSRGQPGVGPGVRTVPDVSFAPYRASARASRARRQRGTGEQARPDDDSRSGEGDRQSIRLDVRRTHRSDGSRIRHRRDNVDECRRRGDRLDRAKTDRAADGVRRGPGAARHPERHVQRRRHRNRRRPRKGPRRVHRPAATSTSAGTRISTS